MNNGDGGWSIKSYTTTTVIPQDLFTVAVTGVVDHVAVVLVRLVHTVHRVVTAILRIETVAAL